MAVVAMLKRLSGSRGELANLGRCDEGRLRMDYQSTEAQSAQALAEGADRRQAQRFTSLIRAAKIAVENGEFVCVIRDVSETGISLRTFHQLPPGDPFTLMLQNGESYLLNRVRDNGTDASFQLRFRSRYPLLHRALMRPSPISRSKAAALFATQGLRLNNPSGCRLAIYRNSGQRSAGGVMRSMVSPSIPPSPCVSLRATWLRSNAHRCSTIEAIGPQGAALTSW